MYQNMAPERTSKVEGYPTEQMMGVVPNDLVRFRILMSENPCIIIIILLGKPQLAFFITKKLIWDRLS